MSQISCFPPADSFHCVISSIIFDFSTEVWSAKLCERCNGIPENIRRWSPYERTDPQAYWPVMSYWWKAMLWILTTFFSAVTRGPTGTYSLLDLRAEQHWPWQTCTELHNQSSGLLSAVNFITWREGKFSFHLWPNYTWSNDLHFIARKEQCFGLYYYY